MKTVTKETETKDEYSRTIVTTTEDTHKVKANGDVVWFDGYTSMDKL